MYMCIHMCLYICIYINTYTYISIDRDIHAFSHSAYACLRLLTWTRTLVRTLTHRNTETHTHTHARLCLHTRKHTQTPHIHKHKQTHKHTHIHTHTRCCWSTERKMRGGGVTVAWGRQGHCCLVMKRLYCQLSHPPEWRNRTPNDTNFSFAGL